MIEDLHYYPNYTIPHFTYGANTKSKNNYEKVPKIQGFRLLIIRLPLILFPCIARKFVD